MELLTVVHDPVVLQIFWAAHVGVVAQPTHRPHWVRGAPLGLKDEAVAG